MTQYNIPSLPLPYDLETKAVLKQLNQANRRLAELKGVALTIPNENILVSTLTLQEAKDSSEVENIVTTQDDLYQGAAESMSDFVANAATKEVLNYREALQHGFHLVKEKGMLTSSVIKEIQQILEHNSAGFRSVPGTALKRSDGKTVYTPPQDKQTILELMDNLERFINDDRISDLDPLIKLAIVHHQFESIHPFYDGNGRTGRIICVLYLVLTGRLDLPILYLSRYITHNKGEYYRLIQAIRDKNDDNAAEWELWILFMLKGVEETAIETTRLVKGISKLMAEFKSILRPKFGKQYRHELLNNLFFHPYTKVEFLEKELAVSRPTATRYLNGLVETGLINKVKVGRSCYYMNLPLMDLFLSVSDSQATESVPPIESVSESL
ncbi:MAG: Fic family protein [Duncaniella sp.]|uniref:Fic family protein n=1 Tax=Duncaniella sp. TaxID=2518496 RepID=UPI0023CB7118|nr:Fic family protein [Duncaniella sp.]MDE5988063.1 Fic family protein [Duncaniella sp.]